MFSFRFGWWEGGAVAELLFPRTDAGVMVQILVVAMITAGGLVWTRYRPEVRVFVVGVAVTLAGLLGVRAIH
ncbi:MAG: hypothetical protein ACE5E8_08475 [Acidimicrobiia bacterium]